MQVQKSSALFVYSYAMISHIILCKLFNLGHLKLEDYTTALEKQLWAAADELRANSKLKAGDFLVRS